MLACTYLTQRCYQELRWDNVSITQTDMSDISSKGGQVTVNPLTPTSGQNRISPYNVNTTSTRWVMRIKKNITFGIIGWSNVKFSKLTL